MKKVLKYNIVASLVIVIALLASCTKDLTQVKLEPEIETSQVEDISSYTAVITGFVVASGDGYSEKGICYNKTGDPTIDDETVVYDGDDSGATFKVTLTGLDYNTTYYARAYGKNSAGVVYGSDTTFTTLPILATLTTADAADITGFAATSGGNITNAGGAAITARGICWSTEPDPDINDTKTEDGVGTGAFNSSMTDLIADTIYYVRAYATNAVGTAYGQEIQFSTLVGIPTVSTVSVTSGETSAVVEGNVSYDGGAGITERGVCYSTSENPTISDNFVTSSGTTGNFSVNLTGLAQNTTYHARAFATNSVGTAYGADISFATYPSELYMTGDGVGLDAENWNWYEPLQLIPDHSHPELFWKIVWMKGSGTFKFAPQAAWSGGDFGKTGDATNGIYAIGSDNIPVPSTAGYYMVVVDFLNGTIEIADPKVYGIGDVFGGWDTYDLSKLFTVDK
ncbi:MAG: SusF/SusE family outer membrane protein [Bacteroidales bacterium]|nr:SusF/SusE family outer membrane protein [Bacteroidales bacterium]